jgi:hypothetical protein
MSTRPDCWRAVTLVVAALLLATTACCSSSVAPPPAGNDDPPPVTNNIEIVMPPDGATVTAPTLLSATGSGISTVEFEVEGTLIFEDRVAPFEWTLNPATYTNGQYEVAVTARHTGGAEIRSVLVTMAPPPTGTNQPPEVLTAVRNLAAGHWYEVPNTKMDGVKPNPVPSPGHIGSVMGAWSGAAFDTKRDRLIVWGGGHTDYSGNEIYVFDLATLMWSRVSDPSPFPPGDGNNGNDEVQHPDGAPISRHSYNYIAYIPDPVDRFFVGGGAGIWSSGQFEDDNTYLFDFNTSRWQTMSKTPVAYIAAFCGVAADGRVWQHGAGPSTSLAVYDATTDTWTSHVDDGGWFSYAFTCDVDTNRNRLLAVGADRTLVWDLNNPNDAVARLQTTGDREVEDSENPGLVYHPGSDRLIAWTGGASVYALDLDTNVWTRIDTSGSVSPGAATGNGTFGRFRYSPTSDLFVTVAAVNRNVFVYRLPD